MVKQRVESVILAALGVWPDGRYQILYFETFEKETADWNNPTPIGNSFSGI